MAETTGENKRKHLEFIQQAIGRMASNSFMLKGWAALTAAAIIAFVARDGDVLYNFTALLVIAAFWGLDGYFLWQERRFRGLYDRVRACDEGEIDFSMDARAVEEQGNGWVRAMFSSTPLLFYGGVGLVLLIHSVLRQALFS